MGKGTGGYKRRLQTAVTNGGYKRQLRRFGNRNETETKPKRNNQHLGWGAMFWPMYCAMVGGGGRGGVGGAGGLFCFLSFFMMFPVRFFLLIILYIF